MRLPVIPTGDRKSPEVLVRIALRADAEIARTFTTSTDLDLGRASINPDRPNVWDANCILECHRPPGTDVEALLDEAEAHFAANGVRCHRWIPSDPPLDSELRRALAARGAVPEETILLSLQRAVEPSRARPDLQVLPARAILPQFRELARRCAEADTSPEAAVHLAACTVDSLDDPRMDVLVGRIDGEAVAMASVFAMGEVGIIRDVTTDPRFRRQGVMRTLMGHVFELASRSQFRQVALEVMPDNLPALAMYEQLGFAEVARIERWTAAAPK